MGFWDALLPGSQDKARDEFLDYIEDQIREADKRGRQAGRAGAKPIVVDKRALQRYVDELRSARSGLLALNVDVNMFDAPVLSAAGATGNVTEGLTSLIDAARILKTAADSTLTVYEAFLVVEATEFDGESGVGAAKWTQALNRQYKQLKKIDPSLTWQEGATVASIAAGVAELDTLRRRVLGGILSDAVQRYYTPSGFLKRELRAEWIERMRALGFSKVQANRLHQLLTDDIRRHGRVAGSARSERFADILDSAIGEIGGRNPEAAAALMERVRSGELAHDLMGKFGIAGSYDSRLARLALRSKVPGVAGIGRALDATATGVGAGAARLRAKLPPAVGDALGKLPLGRTLGKLFGPAMAALDVYGLVTGIKDWKHANGWQKTSTVLTGTSLTLWGASLAALVGVWTAPADAVLVPAATVTSLGAGFTALGGWWAEHREAEAIAEYYEAEKKTIEKKLNAAYVDAAMRELERHRRKAVEEYFESVGSRPALVVIGRSAA